MKNKGLFKLLSLAISLCIILSSITVISVFAADVWNGSDVSTTLEGAGTQADPYQLTSGADLAYISKQVAAGTDYKDKWFALKNDIVLNANHENYASWGKTAPANVFTPIGAFNAGSGSKYFRGNVDGKGYTIYGLYATNSTSQRGVGLFGATHNNKIIDLHIKNSYLSAVNTLGGFSGLANGSTFINCSFEGYMYSSNASGGSAGSAGGIVGHGQGTITITKCYSDGVIDAVGRHAGLVGRSDSAITINYSYSTMDLTKHTLGATAGQAGGLLGFVNAGSATVKNSFFGGKLFDIGTSDQRGPIVGYCNGVTPTVTNAYYLADAELSGKPGTWKNAAAFADGTVLAALNSKLFKQGTKTPVFYELEGEGTNDNPYLISSASDLDYVAAATNVGFDFYNRYFVQNADIEYNTNHVDYASWGTAAPANVWTPIGNQNAYFRGYYDGGNYSIYGLYMKLTGDTGAAINGAGLFGAIHNRKVQNIHIKDSYFYAYRQLGGICGLSNGATITNCSFEGYIYSANTNTTGGSTGGIVGIASSGTTTITKCYTDGVMDATGRHAGIVGSVTAATNVTNCYSVMDLSLHTAGATAGQAGGLVGLVNTSITATVKNSFFAGIIFEGLDSVARGPIVGYALGTATVTNSYYVSDTALEDTNGAELGTNKTATEFADGTVAALLGGQFEDGENYPVFSKPHLDGDGRESNPYLISSVADFEEINRLVLGGNNLEGLNFRLTTNLVLNENAEDYESWKTTAPANEWEPIGKQGKPFAGNFDGAGHTISGMYIDDDTVPAAAGQERAHGFFGATYRGTIKNLHIKDSYVAAYRVVGGMTGTAQETTFENCSFEGYVFGYNTNTSGGSAGGFIGAANMSNTFVKCYTAGTIDSVGRSAGLVGAATANGTNEIFDCYSTMTVTGLGVKDTVGYQTGGLVGIVQNGTMVIENSFFAGFYPTGTQKGPIVGDISGTVEDYNCYYLGTADGLYAENLSAEEFADGTALGLLQGERTENIWIQGEVTPVFAILGDLNFDALIDVADAIIALRDIEKIDAVADASIADVDYDGLITMDDYVIIKTMAIEDIVIGNEVVEAAGWSDFA